jgi:glycosyltransferase involved in cell wall biosynthesis
MKVLFFANTDWYLFNFRLAFARQLRSRGMEVVMVSPPGPYAPRLETEGFRWIPVMMNRRSLNPLSETRLLYRLFLIYRRERPDIAHHFTLKCVFYGSLVARILNVPATVNAITGMGFVFTNKKLRAQLLRPIVSILLRIVLSSPQSKLILQNADDRDTVTSATLVDPSHVIVIPSSGVDVARFRPPERVPDKAGPKIVLLASRLLWDKGIREYIDAARQLRESGCHCEFLLAGRPDPGNPNSVPRSELESWCKQGVITFLGHVENMCILLQRAHVVTLPSYYGEGLPRILAEAAAAGLPIVTTDTPGCRSVVDDGVNGYLIPARDSGSLARALRTILECSQLAIRMGAAGRKKAVAEFDQRLIFDRTIAVYKSLIPAIDVSYFPPEPAGRLPPEANTVL